MICGRLEGKDLVFEFADGAGLLEAKALGCFLKATDHGGRAAEQDLDIVGGLGQPFLRLKRRKKKKKSVSSLQTTRGRALRKRETERTSIISAVT